MDSLGAKSQKLDDVLLEYASSGIAVAFSGGIDSAFLLLRAAKVVQVSNGALCAITVNSPFVPDSEISYCVEFCKSHSIWHEVIDVDVLSYSTIRKNPVNRCYVCKKTIFEAIVSKSNALGLANVLDGTNFDDLGDYRPGLKALEEIEVKSPLALVGLTKADIRSLARVLGIEIWNKPAMACLATRVPFDTDLTVETLRKIEDAEDFLKGMGFKQVRVRVHGDGCNLARIEVGADEFDRFLDSHLRQKTTCRLNELGFEYVTVDLLGYRMGNMNDVIV